MIYGNPLIFGGSGGGSGPSASDAILTVTVPTGSTVTATKGGVTLTPTMWVQAADPTLDCALFVISPSLFDAQNPWTVTATPGTDTANNTVTIDSNKQYDLMLARKWIVRNGLIADSAAVAFQNATVTEEASGYVLVKNTGNNTGGLLGGPVDLSNYSKIVLELTMVNGVYGQSWKGTGVPAVGYGLGFSISNDSVVGFAGLTYLRENIGTITQDDTFQVDISQISSPYYVLCTCGGTASISGTRGFLNVKNFYLE